MLCQIAVLGTWATFSTSTPLARTKKGGARGGGAKVKKNWRGGSGTKIKWCLFAPFLNQIFHEYLN